MQIFCNQRTLEQNRAFHWVVSPSMFVKLSDSTLELPHECFGDLIGAMGDMPSPDSGMPKPFTEFLLSGHFCSPGEQPVPGGQVTVNLADKEKTLNVFGDRLWTAGIPGNPQPITRMPLQYSRAYGGQSYDLNPMGIGFTEDRLPNIESAQETITSAKGRYAPAGFAPLDPSWPQRARYQGTYDKTYMEKYYPGYPADMDWRLFMQAPDDQWFDRFLQGTESFMLKNMHPEHPELTGTLPGLQPRCFVKDTATDIATKDASDTEQSSFREIPLHLDTVWFFPEQDVAQLIWRGGMSVKDDEAEQISHMLLAYEKQAEPRPADHYRNAMERRITDPDPMEDTLNTPDLIPPAEDTALQRMLQASMSNQEASAFIENLEAKADKVKAAAAEVTNNSMADVRKQLDADGLDDKKKKELLEQIFPDKPKPVSDPDTDALLKKIDDLLPGARDSNGKDLNLNSFSFKGLDDLMKNFSSFADKKKEAAAALLKQDLTQLKAMLNTPESNQHIDQEQIRKIEEQIDALENPAPEIPAVPLPRPDTEMIRQKLNSTSPDVQRARQQLHTLQSNPLATDEATVQQAIDRINILEQQSEQQYEKELSALQAQFIEGYRMGAHLSPDGLSPHKDDAAVRSALISLYANDKNAGQKDWACLDLSGRELDGIDFSGCLLEQVNFRGASLKGANLTGAVIVRADFTNADCSGADFSQANIGASTYQNTDFSQATLAETRLSGSHFEQCRFRGATISDPELLDVTINNCDFSQATLKNWILLELKMSGNNFSEASLSGISFLKSTVADCEFTQTSMPSTIWSDTKIKGGTFSGADMTSNCFLAEESDCTYDHLNFSGATLAKANLQKLSFKHADFSNAVLDSANLTSADLTQANMENISGKQATLRKANLNQANFRKADLMEAMLSKAIITDTNLTGANLYGVDFIRATVRGTQFTDANLDATLLKDWRPS